jgi:hypothetical protein
MPVVVDCDGCDYNYWNEDVGCFACVAKSVHATNPQTCPLLEGDKAEVLAAKGETDAE